MNYTPQRCTWIDLENVGSHNLSKVSNKQSLNFPPMIFEGIPLLKFQFPNFRFSLQIFLICPSNISFFLVVICSFFVCDFFDTKNQVLENTTLKSKELGRRERKRRRQEIIRFAAMMKEMFKKFVGKRR